MNGHMAENDKPIKIETVSNPKRFSFDLSRNVPVQYVGCAQSSDPNGVYCLQFEIDLL